MDEADQRMMDEIAKRREMMEKGVLEASIVVPLNKAIRAQQKVLTGDEVRRLMVEHQPIAVTGCGCRSTMNRCDAPVDVCIALGPTAEMLADEETFTVVPIETALDILDRTAEMGLVHLTMYEEGHTPYAICSCCSCCCHELLAMSRFGYSDQVIASDFIAKHDKDACTGCMTCVSRCQFGAISEDGDGVEFTQGACFGCGLCAMTCPSGAISLRERT